MTVVQNYHQAPSRTHPVDTYGKAAYQPPRDSWVFCRHYSHRCPLCQECSAGMVNDFLGPKAAGIPIAPHAPARTPRSATTAPSHSLRVCAEGTLPRHRSTRISHFNDPPDGRPSTLLASNDCGFTEVGDCFVRDAVTVDVSGCIVTCAARRCDCIHSPPPSKLVFFFFIAR